MILFAQIVILFSSSNAFDNAINCHLMADSEIEVIATIFFVSKKYYSYFASHVCARCFATNVFCYYFVQYSYVQQIYYAPIGFYESIKNFSNRYHTSFLYC